MTMTSILPQGKDATLRYKSENGVVPDFLAKSIGNHVCTGIRWERQSGLMMIEFEWIENADPSIYLPIETN